MKIELTDDQVRVVIAGLVELPMKVAGPIVTGIMKQVKAIKDQEEKEKSAQDGKKK